MMDFSDLLISADKAREIVREATRIKELRHEATLEIALAYCYMIITAASTQGRTEVYVDNDMADYLEDRFLHEYKGLMNLQLMSYKIEDVVKHVMPALRASGYEVYYNDYIKRLYIEWEDEE